MSNTVIVNGVNITEKLHELEELKKEISDRQEVENSLTEWVNELTDELNELKRDVKRYFELQYKNQFDHMTQNEIHEMYVLRDKLLKVGKEE